MIKKRFFYVIFNPDEAIGFRDGRVNLFVLTAFFRKQLLLTAGCSLLILSLALPAEGYEGQTEIQFLGGYASMYRSEATPPLAVGSAAFGVGIGYHLSESIGVHLEVNYDWQPPFTVYEWGVIQGQGEEEDYPGWVESYNVEYSSAKTATLSATYALDIMRLIPYLGLTAKKT